ncbi:MAG TPA: nicotinamide riboside transporter PnuC [Vicinamibacterales bacterium]|nr:nicotinamide riboside transporter PnuC [Vicinamibacterales bacterium]HOG29330.1 nicotinamide riboside transporter PnuC [Vicinamibacterales bacterium]HOQ60896.1 nicotinamide riboside transporter PnuC [Vicinamibacterales bacterium]HPK72148.1 nicotinamide riboside transporter PnuC [Vicinamibacterales bacterium]HPW22010.1 nicotinamide riboside transporter PnuC [Vicinamibacterales bacterium]
MNPFEVAGVASGLLGVWLMTRQKIWAWPVLLFSSLVFIVVFFRARLYAAMSLQVVYIGLASYGWHQWLHGGGGHGRLRVSRVPRRVALALAGAGAALTAALGTWLDLRTDQALPYADAFTTSFSLAAQFMQARKYLENWAVWLAVDFVYIGMLRSQDLDLTSLLYLVYLVLAILGLRDWRRSMAAPTLP